MPPRAPSWDIGFPLLVVGVVDLYWLDACTSIRPLIMSQRELSRCRTLLYNAWSTNRFYMRCRCLDWGRHSYLPWTTPLLPRLSA